MHIYNALSKTQQLIQSNTTPSYTKYYWKRRLYDQTLALEVVKSAYSGNWVTNLFGAPNELKLKYGTTAIVSGSSVSLSGSTGTISIYYNGSYTSPYPLTFTNYDNVINTIKGKYIKVDRTDFPNIYYCSNNISFSGTQPTDSEGYPSTTIKPTGCELCTVGYKDENGAWETLSSTSATAYPVLGRSGNYEYFSTGQPKNNLISGCQCFIGEYIGTYNVCDNVVNLPITPIMIIIRKQGETNMSNTYTWYYSYSNTLAGGPNITVSNKKFTIPSTVSVCNGANTKYDYFAIGTP